ncbi:MAG: hypothetical protein DBP02_01645 [gamma proteobacterium symbiont of Ctena orbiculata]|nr:MAG: hypothetical protein DBP02_01645 [gamma proteobacterium symbiont of Ctena orbiculata]
MDASFRDQSDAISLNHSGRAILTEFAFISSPVCEYRFLVIGHDCLYGERWLSFGKANEWKAGEVVETAIQGRLVYDRQDLLHLSAPIKWTDLPLRTM